MKNGILEATPPESGKAIIVDLKPGCTAYCRYCKNEQQMFRSAAQLRCKRCGSHCYRVLKDGRAVLLSRCN
jgi:Zn finger protein HypA/HybF involved in hydrogenase expression